MKFVICERIKSLRKKHGYSQFDIADMLNMSQNAYSELESGKRRLDIERLEQIATHYKITLLQLIPPPEK